MASKYPTHLKPKMSPSTYSSSSSKYQAPFGPAMAQEIFQLDQYEVFENGQDYYDDSIAIEDYNSRDEEKWYQLDLPLSNVKDLEDYYRNEIRRWQKSYHKMMIHALKWHYLMEECEENPQVKKMFGDIQMVRKLGGSNRT